MKQGRPRLDHNAPPYAAGKRGHASPRPPSLAALGCAPTRPEISPIMARLSTYMAEAAASRLPDCGGREGQAAHPRHARRDGLRRRPAARASSRSISRASTRASRSRRLRLQLSSSGPSKQRSSNGILAHSDETDDTHPLSLSHPGAAVVPAALAAGERFGIDGTPLPACRRARLRHRPALHRDARPPAIPGRPPRAARMRSRARSARRRPRDVAPGLTAQQMRWLLSYTAQQGSGIASWQRDTDHIEKAFDFGGMPARNGVTAALLVQAGGTGVDDVLSGADNFFAGVQAAQRSIDGDRSLGRALRSDAHRHQEVDGRLARCRRRSMRSTRF